MHDKDRIELWAKKAAFVAYSVLGLDCNYSVLLIDDPSVNEDGRLNPSTHEIQLNLAKLKPFPPQEEEQKTIHTEEERQLDETYRLLMKTCYVIFHEMRHLYQLQAVRIYELKRMMGGNTMKLLESAKKCELWMSEMQSDSPMETTDIEADANDFAYYLTNRFPIKLEMLKTNRRIGVFKRKYDKVIIPDI